MKLRVFSVALCVTNIITQRATEEAQRATEVDFVLLYAMKGIMDSRRVKQIARRAPTIIATGFNPW